MAIDVSVQYNDGLLLDIIIMLTQCCYHAQGKNPFKSEIKRFSVCSL